MSTVSLEERLAQMGRDLHQELSDGKELSGSFFCRMGKLFVEELLSAELSEALGRDKSQRRGEGQAGYRNGYKSRELRTGEGKIELEVPQVRGRWLKVKFTQMEQKQLDAYIRVRQAMGKKVRDLFAAA